MNKKFTFTLFTKNGRTKHNLYLDIGLAILFVIVMEVYFTGIPLHEWLGLLFTILFVIHIIWHWRWVVNVTQTFFQKLLHESRLNYVLNVVLFIDILILTVSGIVLSRTLGFDLNLSGNVYLAWQTIHALTAQLSLILTALHIALHWRWILTNTRKYLFSLSKNSQQPRESLTPILLKMKRRQSHE